MLLVLLLVIINEIYSFNILNNDYKNKISLRRLYDGINDELSIEAEGDLNNPIQNEVESMINISVSNQNLYVRELKWVGDRIEVILSSNDLNDKNPIGPTLSDIDAVHRHFYDQFESNGDPLEILKKYEVLFASPGVGDVLHRDIDFEVFKTFPITIETLEEYKKKTKFEGTLIERTDKHVSVSQKGRIIKVPREFIKVVSLIKSKYEPHDNEIHKLTK